MIGKIVRALVGRSMAKKRGYSGAAGAVAGLLAPALIKHTGSLLKKGGSAVAEKRRRRHAPKYLGRLT